MKSYILEQSTRMPFHTDMRRVFEALGGRQTEYNWLITDLVHYAGVRRSAANECLSEDLEFPDDLSYYPPESIRRRKS